MNPGHTGYTPIRIGTVGTVALRTNPTMLHTVNVEIATGTVAIYNNAGTTTNLVGIFGGGAAVANTFVCDYEMNNGLFYVSTGTPNITLSIR